MKLVVILGPTASGKSALAVKLAHRLRSGQAKKKFHTGEAEIISADSRQVYKGLEIGSGQITKKEMLGIPHHLLGIASPRKRFTVAQYIKHAKQAIKAIARKNKLPIIAGGTPFYIYALIDGIVIPQVKPDAKMRSKLEKLSIQELFQKLKKLDPQRAKTIESKNKRRLVRALEIILATGKPVPKLEKHPLPYPVLFLGIKKSPEELKRNIRRRFLGMLKKEFLNEVKKLKASGLSWKRIEDFGLEYRQASQYLQGKISKTQMTEQTIRATQDFARRQMTWFKKDPRIHWIKTHRETKPLVSTFLRP